MEKGSDLTEVSEFRVPGGKGSELAEVSGNSGGLLMFQDLVLRKQPQRTGRQLGPHAQTVVCVGSIPTAASPGFL